MITRIPIHGKRDWMKGPRSSPKEQQSSTAEKIELGTKMRQLRMYRHRIIPAHLPEMNVLSQSRTEHHYSRTAFLTEILPLLPWRKTLLIVQIQHLKLFKVGMVQDL
jgi:hypothetical protein